MPATATETEPTTAALTDCLLRLRERAERAGRTDDVAEIDAVFAGDGDAQLRCLIGHVNLTPMEWLTLQFIFDYTQANGFPPTLQEIADEHGCSKVTEWERVRLLIRKGVLVNDRKHAARSLRVVRPGRAR